MPRQGNGHSAGRHWHIALLVVALTLCAARADTLVKLCDAVEGYIREDGKDYRGTVSTTRSGYTCQKWTSQSPWSHETEIDPADGIGDHNYCRNPKGLKSGPGCYTTDPMVSYEPCDVGPPCDAAAVQPTITFEPPTGAHLSAKTGNDYVAVVCYPPPCKIYYTIDGSVPTATSTAYVRPVVLETNSTLMAFATFEDGFTDHEKAVYTVEEASKFPNKISFSPAWDIVYTAPVLVSLTNVMPEDSIVIYLNGAVEGFPYTEPFWIHSTTVVTAVINEEAKKEVTYRLDYTPPAIEVSPNSGSFIGGVRVLVTGSSTAKYYLSRNGGPFIALDDERLIEITEVGSNAISVKAVYLGGATSYANGTYQVVAAVNPRIHPDSSPTYARPINVFCEDPLQRPLVIFTGDTQIGGEDVFQVTLRTPGKHVVGCQYVDNLDQLHSTTLVFELESRMLPPPAFTPRCNDTFPSVPLLLGFSVVWPLYEWAETEHHDERFSIDYAVTDTVRVDYVTRTDSLGYDYTVRPVDPTRPSSFTFSVRVSSTDPLDGSVLDSCTHQLVPLGKLTTPLVVAQPLCYGWDATGDLTIPPACKKLVTSEVLSCLHFYTSEIVSVSTFGSYIAFAIEQLPESLHMEYYNRLGACVKAAVVENFKNETSGLIQLATSWKLAVNYGEPETPTAQTVTSDVPFTVEVRGLDMKKGTYHFVQDTYSCESIGYSPVFGAMTAAAGQNLDHFPLWFNVDAPGSYKLCVHIGDDVYAVPSTSLLTVKAQPLPTLLSSAPCGGLLPPSHREKELTVTYDSAPRSLYSSIYYSINANAWREVLTGNPVTLPAVSSTNNRIQTVVTSVGNVTGTTQTCVFYAPSVDPAINLTVSYHYYIAKGNSTDGKRGVFVTLTGNFSESELIRLNVTDPLTNSTVGYSTAKSSAALGARTVALPEASIPLPAGRTDLPYAVKVTLDGESAVTATPSTVALSPLSIAMSACGNCTSGFCYAAKCVCITNKTAHMCDNEDPTPDDDVPTTSMFARIMALVGYFAVLAVIAAVIFYFIKKGSANPIEAEEVIIDADEEPEGESGGEEHQPASEPSNGSERSHATESDEEDQVNRSWF
ncbi:Kringle domain/Chitobiase/beta-hexosaminidase C-terminal domain/Fn3 associated, putative [Angomonas deanei]|uniref:Kringle domain/Chitobiase/beta-hexosaminidase C-terminal domain/Fn3 associated, putative n=1 Tax=Angomonas deanei TaxID=59799 RepID=A0A7G2CES0_9TRYP|nr:Kringle domain/Chitobiase/beta-hexosaminidase C-terminal domain/Fn3 associated, putative [Angomonas deanei]